jgi:hypothetical protein
MKSVFQDLVDKKVKSLRASHPPVRSAHEGLCLILEEVEELKREVFKRKRKGDPLWLLNELVDIAGHCQQMAEDREHWHDL